MLRKMEKQIYVAPRLIVLLFEVEPVLGNTTYPEVSGEGEDLSKEGTFDSSGLPDSFKSIWDEEE